MICMGCGHYSNPDAEMEREQRSADCSCSCHPKVKTQKEILRERSIARHADHEPRSDPYEDGQYCVECEAILTHDHCTNRYCDVCCNLHCDEYGVDTNL